MGGPHTADHQALSWAESHLLGSLHLRSALFGVVGGGGRGGQVEKKKKVLGAGRTLGLSGTMGLLVRSFLPLVHLGWISASRETPSSL